MYRDQRDQPAPEEEARRHPIKVDHGCIDGVVNPHRHEVRCHDHVRLQ